jgi:hypothetical protein
VSSVSSMPVPVPVPVPVARRARWQPARQGQQVRWHRAPAEPDAAELDAVRAWAWHSACRPVRWERL